MQLTHFEKSQEPLKIKILKFGMLLLALDLLTSLEVPFGLLNKMANQSSASKKLFY